MQLDTFMQLLSESPDRVSFDDAMTVIDSLYDFTPTPFHNGSVFNEAGKNNGSCKLFSFALAQGLTERQTLSCFGAYYRDDVLQHPDADDHQNIRNFIKTGWSGIAFDGVALTPKSE